jgi:hypothetical protein
MRDIVSDVVEGASQCNIVLHFHGGLTMGDVRNVTHNLSVSIAARAAAAENWTGRGPMWDDSR